MNREDFLMLKNNIIYFDNAATTLKPKSVLKKLSEYYLKYTSNIGRGTYDIASISYKNYEETRYLLSKYINCNKDNIIFTNNATDSINKIIYGRFYDYLKENDEVLITVSEHASNILPWYVLSKYKKIKVNYIKLDKDNKVTLDNLKRSITNNTKVVSIAHITNVIGDIRPIKEIIEYCNSLGIKTIIDASQSIGHIKIDVKDLNMDYMFFSTHKMLGPTGVGVIYSKENNLKPLIYGGGMNNNFNIKEKIILEEYPYNQEAGTPNIEGVIAFSESIKYINKIGIDNIEKYEKELTKYFKEELNKLDNVIIYNYNSESSIITFNIKDKSSIEVSNILNKNGICVRTGSHCAKILKEVIGTNDTIRVSLYFYNTKEEIDKLINALKK